MFLSIAENLKINMCLTIVLSFIGWLCTKFDDSNGTLVGNGMLVGTGSIPVVTNEPSCTKQTLMADVIKLKSYIYNMTHGNVLPTTRDTD